MRQSPFILRRCGFTLIETVLASGLFLMATAMVISAVYAFQFSTRQEKVQNELERDVTGVVDHLQRDINLASEILPSWGEYVTSDTSLILDIPVFDYYEVRVPNTSRLIIYEYVSGANGAGSVTRLELTPYDSSNPDEGPQVRDYQVTEGVTDLQLFFDHTDFAILSGSGTPLSDVNNIEVYLTVEIEKDESIYERDYSFSATTRN